MERGILHCDCNSYFASVEILMNPELRGKPVAVAGDPDSRHGIVLAASMEAKRTGIRTTDTIFQAKRKCPDVIFVPPHHHLYSEISKQINGIYLEYTDLVEPFSVDESFIDLTGTRRYQNGEFVSIADELRKRVREEIGVTISVGASFNKVFAKLGSDMKKPDATTYIPREKMAEMVWPLPVTDLLFVGKRTGEALEALGIRTIGDVATKNRIYMLEKLGKHGGTIWDYATGNDFEPVRSYYAEREVKSVSNSWTFPRDLTTPDEIAEGVYALSDQVAARMRSAGKKGYTVQIQLKDADFRTISRQKALEIPTYLRKEIAEVSMELVRANWTPGSPVRLISVGCTDLVDADGSGEQMSLFGESEKWDREKQERLESAVDSIRKKLGRDSIGFGLDRGAAPRRNKKEN